MKTLCNLHGNTARAQRARPSTFVLVNRYRTHWSDTRSTFFFFFVTDTRPDDPTCPRSLSQIPETVIGHPLLPATFRDAYYRWFQCERAGNAKQSDCENRTRELLSPKNAWGSGSLSSLVHNESTLSRGVLQHTYWGSSIWGLLPNLQDPRQFE